MIPEFQKIDLRTWERQAYFEYYYHKIKCKYTLNVRIDVTELLRCKEEKRLKFFPIFLYVILRAVNRNKEFRMSFDVEGNLGYWNYVVPSYTVFHKDDHTFSDIWSEYHEDFGCFYRSVLADVQQYGNIKSIKAKPGQPANFCSVSSLPWLDFTSFSQDTYSESALLFPLIRFGKYTEESGGIQLPLAVFVHHAVADGYHTSKLINDIREYAAHPQEWMGDPESTL